VFGLTFPEVPGGDEPDFGGAASRAFHTFGLAKGNDMAKAILRFGEVNDGFLKCFKCSRTLKYTVDCI